MWFMRYFQGQQCVTIFAWTGAQSLTRQTESEDHKSMNTVVNTWDKC